MVARFVPENTVAEFLDAAEHLSERWQVVVVGSSGYGGDLEVRLASLAERNHRVKWFGHVSDDEVLFSLWENCGAYFHGHSVGGTNPALVQAMALGAPTVARDTIFNREVLADAAIFVRPTADSIHAGITAMMVDERARELHSAQASERADALYTWDRVCEHYARALSALLP